MEVEKRSIGLFIFLVALLGVMLSYFLTLQITDLTEIEKCPACYGVSLCPAFNHGRISLNIFGDIKGFINMLGSKNVLFGVLDDQKIVLKKLGHKAELLEFDDFVCKSAGLTTGCKVNEAIEQHGNLFDLIEQRMLQNQNGNKLASFHLCPSVANVEDLFYHVFLNNMDVNMKDLHANIWTTIMINPEPLILQVLQEQDGWPVAKYLGSCGRVVIEEYAGDMLTSYYNAPWIQRVYLAHQLLVAAHNFTFSHPQFSFYLTDMSSDNIAVDTQGKLKFIDLENIIIVDRNIPNGDMIPSWNIPHETENFDCDGCFAFSTVDICAHRISDHNFYAVCQHLLGPLADSSILPGGLLHDTPPNHIVTQLVQQCSQPVGDAGRFKAAQELVTVLSDVLKKQSYDS